MVIAVSSETVATSIPVMRKPSREEMRIALYRRTKTIVIPRDRIATKDNRRTPSWRRSPGMEWVFVPDEGWARLFPRTTVAVSSRNESIFASRQAGVARGAVIPRRTRVQLPNLGGKLRLGVPVR